MQVFITSSDPYECASNLDTQRLLKQVLECSQVISALDGSYARKHPGQRVPWANHPATRMWQPHLDYLRFLKNCFAAELRRRKTKNGHDFQLKSEIYDQEEVPADIESRKPDFLNDDSILRVHRGNLVRKALEKKQKTGESDHYEWYQSKGFVDPVFTGYVWVIQNERIWITTEVRPGPRNPKREVSVTYVVEGDDHHVVREVTKATKESEASAETASPKKASPKKRKQETSESSSPTKSSRTSRRRSSEAVVIETTTSTTTSTTVVETYGRMTRSMARSLKAK